MTQANFPKNEQERLCALYSYELLDRNVDAVFDTIIRTAADICDVDISVIALIDQDRQYFLARNGMQLKETPRAIAFCAHAILEPEKTFEIPDATKDPRFDDNPLVTGEIRARFYAAQPLTNQKGHAIGGLCLIGKEPKVLNDIQRQTLKNLGGVIMELIESRKATIEIANSLKVAKDTAEIANDAIKSQMKQFDVALENMSQGLCMFDAQARLIVCNELYASMYGLTPELLKPGTSLSEIVKHRVSNGIYAGANPEEYIQERDNWGRTASSERKFHELSDGRRIAISRKPLPDGGWVSTHEDITESQKAEKALMESEARLRAVFDNSPVCLNLKDTEGRYLFANKRYEEWWGLNAEEIIGKKAHEFHADALGVEALTAAEKVVLETGVAYESEISIKRPQDGQIYDRLLSKFPVKSPDGSIMGLGTVAVDITERKRAEEELIRHRDHLQDLIKDATQELKAKAEELKEALASEKKLNELQRQFVSMASHEFRTPLAIIDATAQRMKSRADKGRLTPEDAVKRVEKIRGAVMRMTKLMESTLTAARMNEGKIKFDIRPCDIENVVREVCERQQEVAQIHVISCDLANLPETIQAHTSSLEQVFTNLLSNAVKYAPDAPDIKVTGHREDGDVVVRVRDYGIGIDEDEVGRIGERFFRARTSTGITGTGIGLNSVQKLVEMHNGTISVQSKKGEGSSFTIRLPIAGPDQSEQTDNKVA